jgi:NMD protein affecting ribosome stability and mRNA decay
MQPHKGNADHRRHNRRLEKTARVRCGQKITQEEYEMYDGMCEECYLIEIDELDYEDEGY